MANFDMDSYLAQRFAGVGQNKLAELDKARNDKIAGLQKFRENITANSANILAEKEAQANSWVGQTGLDPNSISGEAVNLAAEGWSGLSRLVGTGVSAVPGLEARRIEGQLASEEYQATSTPDQVKALEARAAKARQAEVNITEAFNRSDIIDQTDRNKLQQELKAGFADPWKQYTEGGQRVYDGDLAGTGDIVSGMARLLYTGVKGAVDNPRAALGYAVENTPQLAVGALPKVGGALLAGSNMSYGNELYSRGIENYRQANNGAMPPDDELRSMALHAASAVAAEQAGDMFSLGSVKGAAKEVSRAGFKESLKNIGAVTGKNYLSEGATEGYQTYAEGQATGDKVTAADIFTGAAIGAMSGAQMASSARALSELTQTTPEAQERKLKSVADLQQEKMDFAAMTKANDPSTLLNPSTRSYNPLKAVGVLFEHAKSTDTTPEVQQANLLKAREVVQNLEATQERNLSLIDDASSAERITATKEELVSLKEQLSLTDTDNEPRILALSKQIAFREEVVALSSDKVALRRLSGEVKRSEQQLSSTRALQENFADRIRKTATVDEVATHIAKATRSIAVDNMPDIEDSRQSVEALVKIAMVSPNSISVEAANNLVNNQNSVLSSEQKNYFRQFSEARIAENTLMSLNKVSQSIFTGTAQDIGIVQHRRSIGQALEAGDQKSAEKSLLALQTFAQNHAEKQGIATKLFGSIRVSGDKQVLKVKTGGWEVVPAGKPLGDAVVKANGGFKIHPNSGEFVGNMQTEVAALNQVVKEQQAAFALKFGKPSASFVATPASASVTSVNTSEAPVQKVAESIQVTPASQTTAVATAAKGNAPFPNSVISEVVYHSTDKDPETFEVLGERAADSEGTFWMGAGSVSSKVGFYTSGNLSYSKAFGKNTLPFYVNLTNPYLVKDNDEIQITQITPEQRDVLIAQGYDGAIYEDPKYRLEEIVVFSPEQVSKVAEVPAVESTTSQTPTETLSVTKQAEGTARPKSNKTAEEKKALEDFQAKAQDRVLRFLAPEEAAKLSAITNKLSSLYKDVLSKTTFYIQSGVRAPASAFHNAPIIGLQAYLFTTEHLIEVTEERRLSYTLAHELAHLKDQATGYESETFDALYKGGLVFDELMGVLQGKQEAFIESMFSYILVSPKVGVNVQRELYAQLAALYANDPQLLKAILPNGYTFIEDQFASSEQKDEQARSESGSVTQEASTTENQASLSTGTPEPRLPRSTGESIGNAGLSALTAEPKSAPNTPYQERNLLVDHFSQAVAGLTAASQRPLVAVKDFISSLGDTLDFSGFLKDYKATDKQEAVLKLFAKTTQEWAPAIQGLLVHGYYTAAGKYNEDRKSFYQNPFNWMIQKDTKGVYSIEENTNTSLVYAAFTALLELADAPFTNSDKTLNAILGRPDDAALPALAYSTLGTVGTRANLLRNSTGKTAVAALGLKVDANAGQNLLPQLEGGMGGMVEAFLLELGLLERQEITAAQMNAVLELTQKIDGKEEGTPFVDDKVVHVFIGLARDNTTGELSAKVQEILEASKGSNNILDKLFSVEAQLKYPSLTPVVSTQTTTKTGQQVPSLLTDTNNQNSSQENFARSDMWKLLNAVAPEVAGAMAGIEEISDTKTQNTKKRSIKAKNDGLWRELNRYHDYVGTTLVDAEGKLTGQGIYFDYSVWLQQRVGIATNVINPQTSKAHRALFYRKTWESKVEIGNEAMMDNFLLRVGEGFGVKTDRNTVEASLEKIEALIENPVIQQAVAALQVVLNTDKGMSAAEQANLVAVVKEGGENYHTLDALVALAHYYQALDTNQGSFVTHIQAEVDGVANGPILAHALFGAAPSVDALNATMERGGIYTEASGTEAFNEWKADPLNHDLYENTITRVIQGIANAVSGNWKEANANAVFFFTGTLTKEDGNISSDGRNIIKGPVTEMVFGSGIPKSLSHMAELFIGKVYDILEKSANGDEKYPPHLVVQNLNKLLSANKQLVPVTLSQAKLFNTKFFLDAAEVSAIKKAFGFVFDAPVTDTIETNFAEFITRRDSFTQMASFTHGLYSTVYAAMRQELIDKLVADDLAKPGTGIPSTYKGDKTNRIPLRDLSKTEERGLEKQLAKLFPVVQTLFSLESKQLKAGLRIGKTSQQVSGSKAYETKVNQRTGQNASTAITVRGLETVQEGPGVGMLPLLIHSLDSYISHSTQMGMELLNIHDAVIAGLDTIYEASEKMNQQTFHALLSYSPMLEMYTALENTVLGLSGLVQTKTGTASLNDGVTAALTAYMVQFAKDNDMDSTTLVLDMLKTAKAEATKADTLKYEAMKSWTYVNQYARENSSYEVTEADQAKIAEKLERVTQEVSASAVRAAEVIASALVLESGSGSVKSKQKLAVDNMPDIPAVPVTRTYSTQDIYTALAYNPVSASFDTHLREVLTDIVEKLHGAFGAFKEAMAQPTALSAVDVFAEAVSSGKAPLTFSLFGSGIKFNDQQAFVAEQVHATVLASLDSADGNKTVVYTELSKLFRETRTRLKDSAWAKDPATAPLYERIFNQIPTDTAGRSNYLAEFAALGLSHEEFNALLKVPTKMEAAVFTDTTILGVLKRLFAKVLETFNGRLTSTVAGQSADKKLKALVTRLVEIENKRTAVLEAERGGFMRFVDKQAQAVRMGKKSAISKIVNSPKFMKNRNVFIGAASGVVATVADSQVGLFFRNIDRLRNEHFSGQQGITMGFLSEMNGPKPVIQKLLRTIKHFEGQRKKIITMTGKFVLQSFDNQGKDLNDFDKRALTKVLLHTGVHSLLDHFDTDKLLTLLKDPKALATEIVSFENQLNGYTPDQKDYFIEQSRALGYWMVTGDITHEMMMKNAHNIARGYESVHAGALSETEVKAATKTLDALASLNALSYTDAAQTGSVAKTLEQELARTDEGNGVRLILLSHKEMEQQAKARLFADGDALMIKGYMPEIYNPHTDVKAANQKEGELLEALGYVAGASVSNDPADFAPEAKRLYTLRDGAAMPWLSGIFSFTGMRAKGTKHHGPRAHRTQQGITQDKQAAIRARNPNQSGQNFDPTQVKDRHMAPLMNALGQAVNYQYMMRNDTKDNLLERDNRFDSVMGALNGSIFDKENSAVHNRKSVEVFFKEFDEGYAKEPKAYLEVSATSTDPELRDIYNMLPKTTKDAIREVWGKDAMMVRASQLDIAFGYRKLSLSSIFDKEEEDRNFVEQSAVWWSEATLRMAGKVRGMSDAEADKYSKRAAVYVRRGENVWKAVVQETKDIFVIKSGVTALANIVSNLTLLKLYGVSSVSALKDMRIAWVGAQDYTRDTERLFVLEAQLASKSVTSGLSDIKNEISQLKDAIARNPVRELIDAGLMPTIVEDVSQDEDLYAYKTQFVRKAEKYTSKLNKGVLTAGKQMYMGHDTQIYKGLSQLTQLSDFVARYALYQHLTTRKDNPIAQKIAIQEASDAFINYDVPMHRELQYLDDMGIMMFTKYFLRIQRVIRGRFRHAPGKVALLMLAQGYFDALPTALDSSIFFKIGNNPLSWGALQFPTSLDEMMTAKAALSLFK